MTTKNKPKFACGQTVFHKASTERLPGVVVSVVETFGNYSYFVDWGPTEGGESDVTEACLSLEYTPDFGVS